MTTDTTDFTTTVDKLFDRVPGYVDTAAVGLPTRNGLAAIRRRIEEWEDGASDPVSFDPDVARARAAYARIVGTAEPKVAIVAQASQVTGVVAASLAEGASVLCAKEDFTSVLFPFLGRPDLDVRIVPLERLLGAVTGDLDLIAVSAAQSSSGVVIDLDQLALLASEHGVRTYVDLTQAAGWIDAGADRFDVTASHGYKWLCSPRGAGFMTINDRGGSWLTPVSAGWYSGELPWESIYGPPLRLASDARRFDVSPAWFSYASAAPTLESLADLGIDRIRRHSLELANAFRDSVGLEESDSPIVSVELDGGIDLGALGVKASSRAGRARFSWYVYNTMDDVELASAAVRGESLSS